MSSIEALRDLSDGLGRGSVLLPDDGLAAYEQPARGAGGPALAVVRPRTTEDVRTVVAWARRHRIRLLPQGANTGLVGASVPPPPPPPPPPPTRPSGRPSATTGDRPLVVLSTELLVGTIDISPADRTAVVDAGVRLSALNEALAEHDLWFPIDLAADPSLGGMVATNTGGARMLRHGDVRRRLLGLEAVLADPDVTVVEDLSTLRKDNTGPDLSSLFVGSGGALGIVTRVAVEVSRRPAERACAYLEPTSPVSVLDVLASLEGTLGPLLSAFEVMSAAAVEAALATVDGVRGPFGDRVPELTVLVEAAGPVGVEGSLADAVADLVDGALVADAVAVPAPDGWRLRHALSEGLARTGEVVGFDVSVPRSELAPFREEVRSRVAAVLPRATVADFGHWGDGGTHCNLVFPAGEPPDPVERDRAREIVFGTAVDDHRGSYSAEHGIGPHNADWWRRVTPAANQRVVRSLRDRCDPDRVLGHPGLPF